ncbi:MAG: threonine synthase [Acidobacteriota bacterium]|nr:threonine synthase [Acidobacteriota bacterium]
MRFISTRGKTPPVDLGTAVREGLAPDGGLYFPERLPHFSAETLEALCGAPTSRVALAIARAFLDEVPAAELGALVADSLDFPLPLVSVGDDVHVFELFHGPTLAFKDVGARFLARLLGRLTSLDRSETPLTILVATSGDTGGAVAHAFYGVAGTSVVVLYPDGQVSPLQEKQFTTLGGNVRAVAVQGTFDDCQRLVKTAFGDPVLGEQIRLTSANSISLGRLLPQVLYYFIAWTALDSRTDAPTVVVPSGNFGNLSAGLIAKRTGLPIGRFVAATNSNDTVPRFLRDGVFDPRPSVRTISNAMDVGNPSNLERIVHLYDGDVAALRRDVVSTSSDDSTTRDAIRVVHDRFGYVLDPHTAVGWAGLAEARAHGEVAGPAILLATAHPAKFRSEVERVIEAEVALPTALAANLDKPSHAVRIPPEPARLAELLVQVKKR